MSQAKTAIYLGADTNQARGIAQYAIDFVSGRVGTGPSEAVHRRVELFHTDSVVCGISALALNTNAPVVLRDEALEYPVPEGGASVFGSSKRVHAEKAVVANSNAVREWDSNGTVFGYNDKLGVSGFQAGEFGHNDFYPVVIAACQQKNLDGKTASLGMIALDEIRGRLCEVFSLKSYKIDHPLHGGIASAAVYGALMGATVDQIECAIGLLVAHYVPWRAIRAGRDLSDSKGASAAINSEMAVLSVHRAMRGFLGPRDIFRNPQSVFLQMQRSLSDDELLRNRLPEITSFCEVFQEERHAEHKDADLAPPNSTFDLVLSHSGDDFAVMGMHFKLGLYEHQSAGALQAIINLISDNPSLIPEDGNGDGRCESISEIKVVAYEPAFGIIGDPAKRNPNTRQSADHSMVFILSRLLQKAMKMGRRQLLGDESSKDSVWKKLILVPEDYGVEALQDESTRAIMEKISFSHGGPEYDSKYPEGIPTSIVLTTHDDQKLDSGLVMFPAGHARNEDADLEGILDNKFRILGALATEDVDTLLNKLKDLPSKSAQEIDAMYSDIDIVFRPEFVGHY